MVDFNKGFKFPEGFKLPENAALKAMSSMAEFKSPITAYVDTIKGGLEVPPNPNLASEFQKRIVEMINNFDAELDAAHEVGMRLVSFGQTIVFHVQDIGYFNPSLIRFFGQTDNGDPVELIQHISQISFLLMKVKRIDPTKPKRKIMIGFTAEQDEDPAN